MYSVLINASFNCKYTEFKFVQITVKPNLKRADLLIKSLTITEIIEPIV